MAERKSRSERMEQLRAKLQLLEAREAEAKRKADNRRKIIIGGTIEAAMRDDPDLRFRIVALLDQRVTRPLDRAAVAEYLPASPAPLLDNAVRPPPVASSPMSPETPPPDRWHDAFSAAT